MKSSIFVGSDVLTSTTDKMWEAMRNTELG